ncbi:hypothetical protein MMC17_008709 [Xylographa soralifera]|nr:hypothetical protein [Xylographa soralifera]
MADQGFDAVNDIRIFDDINATTGTTQPGDLHEIVDVRSPTPPHEPTFQVSITAQPVEDTSNNTLADALETLGVQPSPVLPSRIHPTSEDDHLHITYFPGPPSSRDPTYLTILIPTSPSTHRPLYAQLDTAASANFITSPLLAKIRAISPQPLPISPVRHPDSAPTTLDGEPTTVDRVRTLNGASFSISHTAALTFLLLQLGAAPKEYTLDFEIVEPEMEDDDIPHLLLGAEWLKREHVLTLDPAFAVAVDLGTEGEWIEKRPDWLQQYCFDSPFGKSKSLAVGKTRPDISRPNPKYK